MYFIFGLPRSRTTWLTAFLSSVIVPCYHEKSIEFSSLEKLKDFMVANHCGMCDTALAVHWRWLRVHVPYAKILVVQRPYQECLNALSNIGMPGESKLMQGVRDSIEDIKIETDIPVVSYDTLNQERVVRNICNYLEVPFSASRFTEFSEMMIQPNNTLLLERVVKNIDNFKSLYGEWL